MLELIKTYAPWIITIIMILGPQIPALIQRAVNDKNLLKTFGDVKALTATVDTKSDDFKREFAKYQTMVQQFGSEIESIRSLVENEISNIRDQVNAFQQDELYQKMLVGLSQVNDLIIILENKDQTIERLGEVIKEIKKKLG